MNEVTSTNEHVEDIEPPEGLDDKYEQTIRQAVKILTDDEDRPQGIFLSIHRGGGVEFATGMSPELVSDIGPTQSAVDMLAQHLSIVYQQTQGMDLYELAQHAAHLAKQLDQD